MKTRNLIVVLAIAALLIAGLAACATGPARIGNATGTATGNAMGFGGNVYVTITLDNGLITNVEISAPHDTVMFVTPVVNRAPGMMKQNNSAQFDAISGATVTSVAVSQAAQMAIDMIVAGR